MHIIFTFCFGTDQGHDGGSSGSRDVIYPIPRGLLGARPVVPRGRERTEREEQLQRQIESSSARAGCGGPVSPQLG